jgi:hypothetical protein
MVSSGETMSKDVKNQPEIECTLTVRVGEYGAVCLPSNEGSTGYHWVLPAMPECINRTSDGWFPAITTGPGYTGTPGFHYFVFIGVTPTDKPPKMTFYLMPPGSGRTPARKAVCTVTVWE